MNLQTDRFDLIFALDGMLLDKTYGARYTDAWGLKARLDDVEPEVKHLVTDHPDNYQLEKARSVFIIPKNVGLFPDSKRFIDCKKSQHVAIQRLKEMSQRKRPRIAMLFNDIKIGLHGNYADENDFFEGLDFDCIYAFKSDKDHKAKDIFIDKTYQKHINKELETEWIVTSHLNSILETSKEQDVLSEDIKIPEKINNFYYGDYREGVVDSLNNIKKETSNDYLLGNKQLAKETYMHYLGEKLPMSIVKKYIQKAKFNLFPYEELKTNRQITARMIELIVFSKGLDHIKSDRCAFLSYYKYRSKNDVINVLKKIANDSINEIFEFMNWRS